MINKCNESLGKSQFIVNVKYIERLFQKRRKKEKRMKENRKVSKFG